MARWAAEHAAVVLGTIAAVLVFAAIFGFWIQHRSSAREEAADALARASSEYRQAMGAELGAAMIPEPANPELAVAAREAAVVRFEAVATEHAGTSSAALARLEAGSRQLELGRVDDATTSFEAARDAEPGGAIGALAWSRLAGLAEARGDWAAAAEAHESAAAIESYPGRAESLASAARCWATLEDADRALAAFQRLEVEFPNALAPPDVEALVVELGARTAP